MTTETERQELLSKIHCVLREVWSREFSADEGLEWIDRLLEKHGPQQAEQVPDEATEDMLTAGEDALLARLPLELDAPSDADMLRLAMSEIWSDMLSAAPQQEGSQ